MALIEATAQKYHNLRFNNIAKSLALLIKQAEDNDLSYLQFADILVEHELNLRNNNRLRLNLRRANFSQIKRLDEFDYSFQTTITKKQINSLMDFSFIDNRENIIFIGPPGVGKTHLSIGIAGKAIDAGYKAFFCSSLELLEILELAEIKGNLKQQINSLAKFDLLIIDELGYLPMKKQHMYNLFQFINTMYEMRSLIITTNKDFTNWGDFFCGDNVAVPIVDRIIHHAKIFMLGGESYRLKNSNCV